MPTDRLAHLDEHTTDIAAGVGDVWPTLLDALDRSFSRRGVALCARAVGSADRVRSGPRPLAPGSTLPGFRVTAADPERELVIEGRHRFSTYALIFRLEPLSAERTRLRAESRADFPGVPGRVYRLLVVRTRGHVIAVRRLLAAIRRRSEQRSACILDG